MAMKGATAVEFTDSDTPAQVGSSSSDGGLSPPKRRRPINIVTPEVTASLDRTKVSDRMAVHNLASISRAIGQDPAELALNRWTVRRNRMMHRITAIDEMKADFHQNVQGPPVVHWDGKLLPDVTGDYEHVKVDRLPIHVSNQYHGMEQLLNVPKLLDWGGETIATAVVDTLKSWNLVDKLKALSFDTTASNAGVRGGAAVLIEKKLETRLIHLACRHHVHEVILGEVFTTLFGPSSGPDIQLFKRFQAKWSIIAHGQPENGFTDPNTAADFTQNNDMVDEALEFALGCLKDNHPRDDYRELLELTVIYMGGIPPRGIRIMAPGAMHRARWMAKAIYSLKVFMFRSQFHLTPREARELRAFNIFVCLVYVQAWFLAPRAIEAPLNDLNLFNKLEKFEEINQRVAKAALKALGRHTWYMSQELVALAFFDPRIDNDSKARMTEALENDGENPPPKRPVVKHGTTLPDLITKHTKHFFTILGSPTDWMDKDPATWEDEDTYQEAKKAASGLVVVNDRAERGVALIQDYNKLLTKDEEQKQALLQVVAAHRKMYPDAKKTTVVTQAQK